MTGTLSRPSLWHEALAAARGCKALLLGEKDAFSFFELSPYGLSGAALAALCTQTVLVGLIIILPGASIVSGWAPLVGLWSATALREGAGWLLARHWGAGPRYLAHGVPALWVAALQPVALVAMVLALYVLTRPFPAFPRAASGPLMGLIFGAVVLASMAIALRTLRRGLDLGWGRIALLVAVQILTLPVSFLLFGFLLQAAGYSTATR